MMLKTGITLEYYTLVDQLAGLKIKPFQKLPESVLTLFKPRGKPDSFERTLPSRFVMKALEIYKSYYPHISKIITYIGADESGAFLKHAGFKVDKIVKPSDGWVKRREKELAGVENFYGYDSYKLRVFKQSIETHKKMNKQKFRLIKNL